MCNPCNPCNLRPMTLRSRFMKYKSSHYLLHDTSESKNVILFSINQVTFTEITEQVIAFTEDAGSLNVEPMIESSHQLSFLSTS